MTTGIVRFYNESRRFGFLTTESGEDVFLGGSELQKCGLAHQTIEPGMRLEFVPRADRRGKGLYASEIKLAAGDGDTA